MFSSCVFTAHQTVSLTVKDLSSCSIHSINWTAMLSHTHTHTSQRTHALTESINLLELVSRSCNLLQENGVHLIGKLHCILEVPPSTVVSLQLEESQQ